MISVISRFIKGFSGNINTAILLRYKSALRKENKNNNNNNNNNNDNNNNNFVNIHALCIFK